MELPASECMEEKRVAETAPRKPSSSAATSATSFTWYCAHPRRPLFGHPFRKRVPDEVGTRIAANTIEGRGWWQLSGWFPWCSLCTLFSSIHSLCGELHESFHPTGRAFRLSSNAITVLEKRYLIKDDGGKPVETPEEPVLAGGADDRGGGPPLRRVRRRRGGGGPGLLRLMANRLFVPNPRR